MQRMRDDPRSQKREGRWGEERSYLRVKEVDCHGQAVIRRGVKIRVQLTVVYLDDGEVGHHVAVVVGGGHRNHEGAAAVE